MVVHYPTVGNLQNNDLNPVWNEHFEFIVEDINSQKFTIRIFDDDGLQKSELLGAAQVQIKELEPGKVKEIWLKLVKDLGVQRDNKYRGEVRIELINIYHICIKLCVNVMLRMKWQVID